MGWRNVDLSDFDKSERPAILVEIGEEDCYDPEEFRIGCVGYVTMNHVYENYVSAYFMVNDFESLFLGWMRPANSSCLCIEYFFNARFLIQTLDMG